ncbi:MAG: EAL domain-containing protein, partial [Pseudomonadota bacterium]
LDLAPERVKLDARLTDGLATSVGMASMVRSITDMAHTLDIEVVAKGVEDEAQLAKLRQLGVDYVQGFLLGKPLTVAELATQLSNPQPFSSQSQLKALFGSA